MLFEKGGVSSGRHFCFFLKLPGKIVDGGIAQRHGDLREGHISFGDQAFCGIDFHMGKAGYYTMPALFPKELFEPGAANQIIPADFVDGKLHEQMSFQVLEKGKVLKV